MIAKRTMSFFHNQKEVRSANIKHQKFTTEMQTLLRFSLAIDAAEVPENMVSTYNISHNRI